MSLFCQSCIGFSRQFRPVGAFISRNYPQSGIRHASLTSNIARAARKLAAIDKYRDDLNRPRRDERRTSSRQQRTTTSDENFQSYPEQKTSDRFRTSVRDEASQNFRRRWDSPEKTPRSNDGYHVDDHSPRWEGRGRSSRTDDGRQSSDYTKKTGKGAGNIKKKRGKDHRPTDTVPERVKPNVPVPQSIPYTTPASEFIYGTSAVDAALRCSRRKLYVLYIYQGVGEELSPEKVTLRKIALSRGIKVKMAFAGWDALLDKMSAGRPHNGLVLEASLMPQLPVTQLRPAHSPAEDFFEVGLDKQSLEEAEVNGSNNRIPRVERFESIEKSRYPLAILLDGIVDPGNMGAIIRSAYYLGVDAIILTGRNSAPLSPVTIKASAGAAENMTILKANNEVDFIKRSRENGWRFYAADSPQNVADLATRHSTLADNAASITHNEPNHRASLLVSAPTVLMLGNEGTGLLPKIKTQADGYISIPGARIRPDLGINDPARVDSLNVSVAAALLIEMLMQVPLQVASATPLTSLNSTKETPIQATASRSFDFN